MRQQNLFTTHWKHRYCAGGTLRRQRAGRRARPLSTKDPVHSVFKSGHRLFRRPRTFKIVQILIWQYAKRFHIRVEQTAIVHDHIHLLIRTSRRLLRACWLLNSCSFPHCECFTIKRPLLKWQKNLQSHRWPRNALSPSFLGRQLPLLLKMGCDNSLK